MYKIKCYDSAGNPLKHLYQWDVNRVIIVKGLPDDPTVFHFCNSDNSVAYVVTPEVLEDGYSVIVPNTLLETAEPIFLYSYQQNGDNSFRTTFLIRVPVIERSKPEDYIYGDYQQYYTVASVNARLSNLIHALSGEASGSTDIEVIDMRDIGDGEEYETAGDALRALASEVFDMRNINDDNSPYDAAGDALRAVASRVSDLESNKVDKVPGKGLSQNDYTNADKAALDNIKTTDTGLNVAGKAADAKATGDAINELVDNKVNKPMTSPDGTPGQVLRTFGNGATEWADVGRPTDEQTMDAVQTWLDANPSALSDAVVAEKMTKYATVADMQDDTVLTAGQIVVTLGSRARGDMGGCAYYISDSAVQNEYCIELDNGKYAVMIPPKDNVTPEMFGAAGDNSTDDYSAITAAFSYAYSHNLPLVFRKSVSYKTATPIVVANVPNEVTMLGTITYSGSGTALTFGTASGTTNRKRLRLRAIGSNTADSVGVKIINAFRWIVEIDYIKGFETGLRIEGDTYGCAYNTFYLNEIGNFQYGIVLCSVGNGESATIPDPNDPSSTIPNPDYAGGWVNENTFHKGKIHCETQNTWKSTCIGVFLDSAGYIFNNNVFYDTCLEGLHTAVKINNGEWNYFYNIRTEAVTTNCLLVNNKAHHNIVTSGYGPSSRSTSIETANATPNIYISQSELMGEYFNKPLFDSGNLARGYVSNGTEVCLTKCCKLEGYVNGTMLYDTGDISVSGDSIAFAAVDSVARRISVGTEVSTVKNKIIKLAFDIADNTDSGGTRSLYALMYASDGTKITETSGADSQKLFYLTNNTGPSRPFKYGSYPTVSGSSIYCHISSVSGTGNTLYIIVPEECAYMWIGIAPTRNQTFKLSFLKIFGRYEDYTRKMLNYDHPVLSDMPTSVAPKNTFVQRFSFDAADDTGWLYNGTRWLGYKTADADSSTGIATISDAVRGPVKSIIVSNIEPTQTGTGDPSSENVRPITGYTGLNIIVSPTTDAQDGITYPVSWESGVGTIYAGTVNVTTGLLTVTMKSLDLGSVNWNRRKSPKSGADYYLFDYAVPNGKATPTKNKCSIYPFVGAYSNMSTDKCCGYIYTSSIAVRDDSYETKEAFKTAMSGVQFVYELAAPLQYAITPTQVATLIGTNKIWSDIGLASVRYESNGATV